MDTIIYYSENGRNFSGTFKNVPVVMICVPIIFIMNTRFTFSQKESASFSSTTVPIEVEKRQPDPGGYKSDPYDTCSGG